MINLNLSASPSPLVRQSTHPRGLARAAGSRAPSLLNKASLGPAALTLMAFWVGASSALGGIVTYVTPTNASNSNANLPTGVNYNNNMGYAFTTGPSGVFDIDWVNLDLNTSALTAGAGSITVAIHAASNNTVYSAVASSTAYATDTVSFTMPGTTSTAFTLNLTAAELPNISTYQLQPSTSYALILYNSPGIGIRRTTGLANGTTNGNYTVSNGFTMLDTFRNNSANYTNNANSYPTVGISFGSGSLVTAATPEPAGFLLGGVPALAGVGALLRRRERPAQAASRGRGIVA